MRPLIVLITIYLCSCNTNKQNSKKDVKESVLVNQDSIAKVDSMKWIYYSLNYFGTALFYDSLSREEIKLIPVECDVILDEYRPVTNDSSYYLFSFNRQEYSFRYVNAGSTDGIGVYRNNVYPLTGHVKFDYQNSQDSINSYLAKADSAFRVYLKKYSGKKMSPWLKQEAVRRNILQ
jgi:hypothetical protein